ncbi:hypothetical protein CHS0354_041084 [Potamilus streckersoni]|uniref:G-protein coupled receptors family 1 profile domain-containing protein n=1 Tax=Potamilus streckersoni TaxID=2493646 RepID=A0AAE0VU32_9BIVA|nr:hypothetical protein CHS0354_041084 [Potamilus streckersoni]
MTNSLNQNFTCKGYTYVPNGADIAKTITIIVVMVFIIVGNVFCLAVFNGKQSRRYFQKRIRYTMNSLCCTDLAMGALMCPSTLYSGLYHCWPFGESFCKIEALIISALFHESTLNLVLIAADRFFVIHYPFRYNSFMNSRKYMFVILATWIVVFLTYAIVIFAGEQFYFDEIGINCEPYYENSKVTVSVISLFYFLPAALFIFSYVFIYRTATKRRLTTPNLEDEDMEERRTSKNIRTTKYLAAITLGFFVAISPWTLCTLVIATTDVKLNPDLDFFVTWLAISNSFMNSLIYGAMNRKFRAAAMSWACGRWIKSIKTGLSSSKGADFSEDTSGSRMTPKQHKISKKKGTPNHTNDLELSRASTPRIQRKSMEQLVDK